MEILARRPAVRSQRKRTPITVLAGVRQQTPTFPKEVLKALNRVLGPR
jgi:hypothetical protein